MSKTIPSQLLDHYETGQTTTCLLVRLEMKDGAIYGFTSLDVDVVYDDGDGDVTYKADNGVTLSRIESAADLGVDNADLMGFVAATGISEQKIRAGLFDYAKARVYKVNYNDLTAGRHEIIAVGTAGQTRFDNRGWITEFRSLTQQLKQPLSQPYSTTCRAQFGSQPIGTPDAEITERKPCGVAMAWTAGAVTSVDGTEPDRIFTDTSIAQADGFYVPGVVRWLTGDNAGFQMEIDAQASDQITLAMPLPYPIQIGDTYERRQDCNKIAVTIGDVQGDCKDRHDNLLKFRGEHLTPVADGGRSLVPGAEIQRA